MFPAWVFAEAPPMALSEPVHHLESLAREPMVVEHPDGTLFVAGYGSQVTGVDPNVAPNLWRSGNAGKTWQRVNVGTAADGAAGNSDVDLAVGPDGTLYFLVMGFDRSVREGTHIAVGVSHDAAASWQWTRLSQTRFDDRPWIDIAPDGTAHVIWNDDQGVSYATSHDRGKTWTEHERIHDQGGSSHLAVGPGGEIAVRISPIAASANRFAEGVDLIAISTDGGTTWRKHQAPGERLWDPTFSNPAAIPRWVEPLAWGADGALYYLWSEGTGVRLGRSGDEGASWKTWTVGEETAPAYFPYLAASGSGELAATWFSGFGDTLSAQLARISVPEATDAELDIRRAQPFQIDAWAEVDEETPARTVAGEYIPVIFLADGRLGVVAPIQDIARDRWGFTWWTSVKPSAATDPSAASADVQGCRPLDLDRGSLLGIRASGFEIEDPARREQFARALLDCLGDPDPTLRDGVAYEGFATLLRGKQLSRDTVRHLRTALLDQLEDREADASGVRRPFAALVLSEVARADRIEETFSAAERNDLVDRASAYVRGVRDYRGFDADQGWRHGVAHGADLLMQLALNPAVADAQLLEIRSAVAAQIAPPGEHFYIYGEPGRLARPVLFLAQRGAFTEAEWSGWFEALASPAPLESWGDAFASQEGLAKLHNTKAFALAIYTDATASGEVAFEPLASGALELLRALH